MCVLRFTNCEYFYYSSNSNVVFHVALCQYVCILWEFIYNIAYLAYYIVTFYPYLIWEGVEPPWLQATPLGWVKSDRALSVFFQNSGYCLICCRKRNNVLCSKNDYACFCVLVMCVCAYVSVHMCLYVCRCAIVFVCIWASCVCDVCEDMCACVCMYAGARERVYLCADNTNRCSQRRQVVHVFPYMDVCWAVFILTSTLKQRCLKAMPKFNVREFDNSYCESIICYLIFARNSLNSDDILVIS